MPQKHVKAKIEINILLTITIISDKFGLSRFIQRNLKFIPGKRVFGKFINPKSTLTNVEFSKLFIKLSYIILVILLHD